VQIYKTTFNLQVLFELFLKYYIFMIQPRSECPLSYSLDVFGDKWSLLIIRDLLFTNKCTYNDFIKSDEGIATNILAARLKSLEENGIIEKLDHPESKAKKLYKLTQKGIELLPIIIEIYIWTDKYFTMPAELKERIKEAKKDKEKFIKQVLNDLKSK